MSIHEQSGVFGIDGSCDPQHIPHLTQVSPSKLNIIYALYIYLTTPPFFSIQVILEELARLGSELVKPADLSRAKNMLKS